MDVTRQPQKLLFICSRNKLRSLTAEEIFKGIPGYQVKSAGTEPNARIRVNEGHIRWADLIFVMEKEHGQKLHLKFQEALVGKRIICLHIPDIYHFMEPELIELLKASVEDYIELPK